MSGTEQGKSHEATSKEPVERNAGYMIAVRAEGDGAERKAIDILRAQGAHDMGRVTGTWLPGAQPAWTDFDPRKPIQRV